MRRVLLLGSAPHRPPKERLVTCGARAVWFAENPVKFPA